MTDNEIMALPGDDAGAVETSEKPEMRVGPEAEARVAAHYPELFEKAWVRKRRSPTAKLTRGKRGGNVLNIARSAIAGADDADAQLVFNASLGSTEPAFGDALVAMLGNATANREGVDPQAFGFAMAVIQGIEPGDEIEGMLAAQMAAVHLASMVFARRLTNVETLAQQDSASNAFNKLTRTFAAQMEALKRYRTGGEQKVIVQHQHVTVNDGGQAVVGSVNHGGRGREEK
ncbi:MAG: hypothetical protein U1E59_12380 [Amaricoccus sp.]